MHQDDGATVPEYVEQNHRRWFVRRALESEPATGRHDARDSVRSAAVAGKLAHRTDRAARRGLRGRGERR